VIWDFLATPVIVVIGIVLGYAIVGVLLAILMWFDAKRPPWGLLMWGVAIGLAPLAMLEIVLVRILSRERNL